MSKKFSVKMTQADLHGKRLDQVLQALLKLQQEMTVSRSAVRRAIEKGSVYVNTKRVHIASRAVFLGAQIDIFLDPPQPVLEVCLDVLYEDEDLIFVNKPAGLPCVPTIDQSRLCVSHIVQQYLNKKKPNSYLGIHHRLDLDTSGVMLFTKQQRINRSVALWFSDRKIKKTYQLLVALRPSPWLREKKFCITTHHGVKGVFQKKKRYGSVRSGGDVAITHFEWVEQSLSHTFGWLKASPVTGRTHQIRAHASESGFSILGDTFYGGMRRLVVHDGEYLLDRPYLHAASLEFQHPITQQEMTIHAPLPAQFHACWSFAQQVPCQKGLL